MSERGTEYDIILFDGQCVLCNWVVRFVIPRDPRRRFRFAPLESPLGQAYAQKAAQAGGSRSGTTRAGEDAGSDIERTDRRKSPDSFLLVRGDRIYMKSRAGLEVVRRLRGLWPLLYAFAIVPGPIRDRVYDWIARNRYRLFGRYDSCLMPSPDIRDRFIE